MVKSIKGKTYIRIDTEKKNSHRFADGTELKLARGWNNLNGREVSPVQGICEYSDIIPKGAEVIVHYTTVQNDTYKVFDERLISGEDIAKGIFLYSIPNDYIFLYRCDNEEDWMPLKGFQIAHRVFQPTIMDAKVYIPTKVINDRLYISKGTYEGNCLITAKACDYELVFQGRNGQEERVIRMKDDYFECLAIDDGMTEKIKKGELLIGLNADTATKWVK